MNSHMKPIQLQDNLMNEMNEGQRSVGIRGQPLTYYSLLLHPVSTWFFTINLTGRCSRCG
ncbi:MAG: hypothetical protein PHY16_06890 [Methylobacter sp.]|nr:hypothetical protein [Methylobacter sp.]